MEKKKIYQGGCHCGRVRFEVKLKSQLALECHCSICTKKGFLHVIIPEEDFRFLQGEDDLTIYQFHTKVAKHMFCKVCGIHSVYRPRSHPDHWDVNARCLDGDVWVHFQIQPFDGHPDDEE